VKAANTLAARELNLRGWGCPADDCVNVDGWVVAAIAALPPGAVMPRHY
jgi:hypothetical protein